MANKQIFLLMILYMVYSVTIAAPIVDPVRIPEFIEWKVNKCFESEDFD